MGIIKKCGTCGTELKSLKDDCPTCYPPRKITPEEPAKVAESEKK